MTTDKKSFSNLDKLKGSNLKNFKNEKDQVKKNKNLLIKTSETSIDFFKIKSFEFYKEEKELSLYSYRHYIVLCLLTIESDFKLKYKTISIPDDDYLAFYKKRGTRSNIETDLGELASINFLLPTRYAELYFNLMHTYYINECSGLTSYSISQFFLYIVRYIEKHKVVFQTINL